MIGGKKQLAVVVAEAIDEVDERYGGYRTDLAKAIVEVIDAQDTSATDRAKRDRIQTIVESLGTSIAASSRE